MSNTIDGGYTLAPMEACCLPEKVATGFAQVLEHMTGANYQPVLYVGTQVVHGINHMILCKQTLVVEGAPEHLVKMVLNQNLDSGCSGLVGQWSLVCIEQIV